MRMSGIAVPAQRDHDWRLDAAGSESGTTPLPTSWRSGPRHRYSFFVRESESVAIWA